MSDAADADTIVVHTCSFIEAAKKESINTILEAGKMKGENKKLIVTGCLVQQHGKEIFDDLPEVDAFLGTGQLAQVADLFEKPQPRGLYGPRQAGRLHGTPDEPIVARKPNGSQRPFCAFPKLGCSHPCSFCADSRDCAAPSRAAAKKPFCAKCGNLPLKESRNSASLARIREIGAEIFQIVKTLWVLPALLPALRSLEMTVRDYLGFYDQLVRFRRALDPAHVHAPGLIHG